MAFGRSVIVTVPDQDNLGVTREKLPNHENH
jgi:hypothetical protein